MTEKEENKLRCFTIGHSVHEPDHFLKLLKMYRINCVVDLRSSPFSARAPQFNRDIIKKYLTDRGILYIYMGSQLGARYDSPEFLDRDGKVKLEVVMKSDFFRDGLKRVIDGISKGYTIALMCSEKDPIQCHRFVLVSHSLSVIGVSISHILEDGSILSQESLEGTILKKYAVDYEQMSLFGENLSRDEAIDKALSEYWKRIAYKSTEAEITE